MASIFSISLKRTFKIYFFTYVAILGKTWMKSFSFVLYRFVWKQFLVIIFSSFKIIEILIGHFVSIENKRNHRYNDHRHSHSERNSICTLLTNWVYGAESKALTALECEWNSFIQDKRKSSFCCSVELKEKQKEGRVCKKTNQSNA